MAQWLSWLERRPVTAEVAGSSPAGVVGNESYFWDHSSAGRAPALQAGGHRFEPCWSHQPSNRLNAAVAELADAQDLKSCGTYTPVPVRFRFAALKRLEYNLFLYVGVAQLDRAFGYGPKGREFESSHPRLRPLYLWI